MKKFKSSLGALAIATLFFAFSSCSNGSDTPLAYGALDASAPSTTGGTDTTGSPTTTPGTDVAGGGNGGSTGGGQTAGSESSRLPSSVGTNELAGKTFKLDSFMGMASTQNATLKFEADTYTESTTLMTTPATQYASECSVESIDTYSYTYDSNLKILYYVKQKSETAYVRNGVKFDPSLDAFSTDTEFITSMKKSLKTLNDLASDDFIETRAKQARKTFFSQFGYTDTSCETPVSDEIIAKYNEAQNQAQNQVENSPKLISNQSYSLSNTELKLGGGNRFPAGKDFNELYDNYKLGSTYLSIKNYSDNIAYGLYQYDSSNALIATMGSTSGNSMDIFNLPTFNTFSFSIIVKSGGLLAYKISSVDANAIHTSSTGTRADTTAEFSFTDENKEFKYTMTKSENGAVIEIEGLGKINITYATQATIPDFTYASVYTLQ